MEDDLLVQTEKEWDDKYRKFEANYDTRRDEKRRPRPNALILVGLLLIASSVAGLLAVKYFFA